LQEWEYTESARPYGFVPGKSTCTQLLHMTQEFAEFINDSVSIHAVYFDLQAAFDKVDQGLILRKMIHLELCEKIVSCCRNRLAGRTVR
jgi:hypothetical protein